MLSVSMHCAMISFHMKQRIIATSVAHSSVGNTDCDGSLNGVVQGDEADVICNECEVVICTVPAISLDHAFNEIMIKAVSSGELGYQPRRVCNSPVLR